MSDSDEYDFPEFSQEDLARIDADIARVREGGGGSHAQALEESTQENGGPPLQVEFEAQPCDPPRGELQDVQPDSPYATFRAWKKVLSVTDLASPQWCEVQFDYGLRQMRHLPVSKRPELFTSASGKEIPVAKTISIKNEVILEKGRSVHKVLEKEVKPEEIRVDVNTEEERWGLRLANMIASITSLKEIRKTREMPVFGFVQNQPVVGIIDEIHYLPSGAAISLAETGAMYTTLRKKKRKSQAPDDPSQASLTRFFPTSPSKLAKEDNESPSVPEQVTTYDLYLVDTKTRRSTSLPPDEDTVSSRLQLMLYRRLLSALLSTFDFDVFWAVLGVDSAAPLSPRFAQQVGTLVTGRSGAVERLTLDGLAAHWVAAVHDLGIARVSPRMTLVYRAQALRAKRRRLVSDTADLQAAVQASLQDAGLEADPALVKELASSIASPSGASGSDAGAGGAMKPASEGEASRVWALQPEHVKDTVLTPVTSIPKEHAASGTAPSDSIPLSGILGTKEFALDDAFLDAHLAQTLGYWYGLRQPEGVPVELSRRCFTCEYCEGCEWREAKAQKAMSQYQAKATAEASL